MGYPRVRIAPIVGWSGGLGVSVFMEPLMERCSSVVHLSGVRRSVSSLVGEKGCACVILFKIS